MIRFKHTALQGEFEEAPNEDGAKLSSGLRLIVFALAGFADYHFGKDVVITHILRSQAQQDEFYRENPRYKGKPWKSVHQLGRGIDIRSSLFNRGEIDRIIGYLNLHFLYGGGKPTALYHNIGRGAHLHLQVAGNEIISGLS